MLYSMLCASTGVLSNFDPKVIGHLQVTLNFLCLFYSLKRRVLPVYMYSLSFFLLPKVSHSSVYSINLLSIFSHSFIYLTFCLLIHLGCLYLTHLFKCVSTSIVGKHFKWVFKLNYLILSPSVSSKLTFTVIHINLEF